MTSLKHTLKFLSLLSFRKCGNALHIYFSYFRASLFKNVKASHFPFSFAVEPSSHCNLQCPECPVGMGILKRKKGNLALIDFQKWIADISKYLINISFYFQGEPLLNKEINKMIRHAVDKKIWTTMSTNANLIDKKMAEEIVASGLHQLIISVDAFDKESYERYRREGDFDKVIEAFTLIKQAKKQQKTTFPKLVAQNLVFKYNEDKLPQITEQCKRAGANSVVFKSPQFYDIENAKEMMSRVKKYQRYTFEKEKLQQKRKIKNRCFRLWSSSVACWNGDIVPCCYDKDANYIMGNLQEDTFTSIWRNTNYKNFRNKVFTQKSSVDICTNCKG